MTIAIVTSVEHERPVTHACPATQLVGYSGALTLWSRSKKPITIPWAWVYWLRFEELAA